MLTVYIATNGDSVSYYVIILFIELLQYYIANAYIDVNIISN